MSDVFQTISGYINAHRDEMLDKLVELVNLEGHFEEKDNVKKALDWVRAAFEAEGFVCEYTEMAPHLCGILTGVLGADRPGRPIILSGHVDTVFHAGAFGGPNPCRVEGGKIYGPGVLDMKGGIIIALYIVKALNAAGYDKHPLKIIFAGEEETDHKETDGDLFIMEQSRGALCAFNMECAELGNELAIGQKCQITYTVQVKGEGGHAGNEFLRGRNAVHEAVMKIYDIIPLTDLATGTTITTSVIHGGGHTSGIPDLCDFVVDVRANGEDEQRRIENAMEAILGKTHIDGTRTTYSVYYAKMRPYVETEGISQLHALVNRAAVENGHPPFGKMLRGGTTDAGNMAAAGVPVLCGCGLRGDFAHNTREYGVVDSLYDRAAIFATAIYNM